MGRELGNIYLFISDESGRFYRATQRLDGGYSISVQAQPYPMRWNPSNLFDSDIEMATNPKYFSLARSVTYPLEFIKDGAAILRHLYYTGRGVEQKAYLTIVQWNGNSGVHELTYFGRFDFSQRKEDPKKGTFTCPTVDDSAWGTLSQNDDVVYSFECNERNPRAIPVVFDGITLENRYTYQTVQAPIFHVSTKNVLSCPFVLVNEDGDSYGIIANSQTFQEFNTPQELIESESWFFTSPRGIQNLEIKGNFKFTWSTASISGTLGIMIRTSLNRQFIFFKTYNPTTPLIPGRTYDIPIDLLIDLEPSEKLFFVVEMTNNPGFTITPIVTNILVRALTKTEDTICYGLRPLDLLREIVLKATDGRFTINSSFFEEQNKHIIFSGDSLRGYPNAKLYTSFSQFYKTFNSMFFMALKDVSGTLWLEKATDVYKQDSTIIDIGECIDLEISPAKEYFGNEIEVGCPKQDFRRSSGRMEFNSTNTFSLPFINVKKKLDLVSAYRLGCYDIQFILLDYKNGSTQDNKGDTSVYVAEITDELGSGTDFVETFENIEINNEPLSPIVKFPLNGDIITNDRPTIRGKAQQGAIVNIYVDGVLDGTTLADANYNWVYDIVNPLSSYVPGGSTGVHTIEATFTDLVAQTTSVTVVIDTSAVTVPLIAYPRNNSNLFNNKPYITGFAQAGQNVDIFIDGSIVGQVIADGSNRWSFQSPVLIFGNHAIEIITNTGSDVANILVNSSVSYPLITAIDGPLDGNVIVNNMPLIEGVAIPGTIVKIWLNYNSNTPIGESTADVNGNWSIQTTDVQYIDSVTGQPVILVPIVNGFNVVSTGLENNTVPIAISGYKLNRPNFTVINGVLDNTVFNTSYSPKRMLMSHYPMLASIMANQSGGIISFETADKNRNLETVLNGVRIDEDADITVSSLGNPLLMLEYANVKVKSLRSFNEALYDFKNGGIIKATYRGNELFMLPIGSMKMSSFRSEVQEWKLIMSPQTSFQSLMNLYKNGLTIRLMKKSLYHSDYNSLHFVAYDFQRAEKYNQSDIYSDWFENRNDQWIYNPKYIQKFQKSEVIIDQIITNGLAAPILRMHRCSDAKIVGTFNYSAVSPAPIPGPDIVMETQIDFSLFPEGDYFFVMVVSGKEVSISEKVSLREFWKGTILIEASNSINQTGCFFSTGFKSILRVEGLVKKLQPTVDKIVAEDEMKNQQMLFSNIGKKRIIRFGTAYGLPDYLYMKVASALILDDLMVEGISYVIDEEEGITASDDVPGHPLYYYDVTLNEKSASTGNTLPGEDGADTNSVILVVDATAFGLPAGSLININITD